MRAVVLALAATVATSDTSPAQDASASRSAQPAAITERLIGVLTDVRAGTAQREEAARRLFEQDSPGALQSLQSLLTDPHNREGQLAVSHALVDAPRPDGRFVGPLIKLLGGDVALSDAASQALTRFSDNQDAVRALLRMAADRNAGVGARVAAIKAAGAILDRGAAHQLVDLLSSEQEPAAVRNAAADALGELTALPFGRDFSRWQRWRSDTDAMDDSTWKAALAAPRAARAAAMARSNEQLAAETESLLSDEFQSAAAKQRPGIMLRFLNSPHPVVRAIGVRILDNSTSLGQPIPEAGARLRDMIGDSDRNVRIQVAKALGNINDKESLDTMVSQLGVERNNEVRAAIVSALGVLGNARPGPVIDALFGLLQEPSPAVAQAAAASIGRIGGELAKKDAQMAHQLAERLRRRADELREKPGADELRGAVVAAVGPLRDPETLKWGSNLLNRGEPVFVRRAALQALGDLRSPDAAPSIVSWIDEEPDAHTRALSIRALGASGAREYADTLLARMDSNQPQEVRQAAWEVFKGVLPASSPQRLGTWASQPQIKNDPEKQIAVLQELCVKLKENGQLLDRGYQLQNIGTNFMKLRQHASAARAFGEALDELRKHEVPPQTLAGLINQNMDALLADRNYAGAVKFAQNMLSSSTDPAQTKDLQQTMGSKLKNEAERLKNAREDAAAKTLIEAALQMKPPLDEMYSEDLRKIRSELRENGERPGQE